MKLSQLYADFNIEINDSIPYYTAPLNAAHLKLSGTETADATAHLGVWNPIYARYVDPAQHTDQVVIDIKNEYGKVLHFNNGIKQQVKHDKSVTLTGGDITKMHLHVDHPHRNSIPVPAITPNNQVINTTRLINRIRSNNPLPGLADENNLPVDVGRIGRKIAVVPAGAPPPAAASYHSIDTIGAVTYDIVFAPEQAGATCYLITWYENPAGKHGTESVPLSFPII